MPTFWEYTRYTPSRELEEVYELRRKAKKKREGVRVESEKHRSSSKDARRRKDQQQP